jgi:hypothetical protein
LAFGIPSWRRAFGREPVVSPPPSNAPHKKNLSTTIFQGLRSIPSSSSCPWQQIPSCASSQAAGKKLHNEVYRPGGVVVELPIIRSYRKPGKVASIVACILEANLILCNLLNLGEQKSSYRQGDVTMVISLPAHGTCSSKLMFSCFQVVCASDQALNSVALICKRQINCTSADGEKDVKGCCGWLWKNRERQPAPTLKCVI